MYVYIYIYIYTYIYIYIYTYIYIHLSLSLYIYIYTYIYIYLFIYMYTLIISVFPTLRGLGRGQATEGRTCAGRLWRHSSSECDGAGRLWRHSSSECDGAGRLWRHSSSECDGAGRLWRHSGEVFGADLLGVDSVSWFWHCEDLIQFSLGLSHRSVRMLSGIRDSGTDLARIRFNFPSGFGGTLGKDLCQCNVQEANVIIVCSQM